MPQTFPTALEANRAQVERRIARFAQALGEPIDLADGVWHDETRDGVRARTVEGRTYSLTVTAVPDRVIDYTRRRFSSDTPAIQPPPLALLEAAGYPRNGWRPTVEPGGTRLDWFHDGYRAPVRAVAVIAGDRVGSFLATPLEPRFVRTPRRIVPAAMARAAAEAVWRRWNPSLRDRLDLFPNSPMWRPLARPHSLCTLVYCFYGPAHVTPISTILDTLNQPIPEVSQHAEIWIDAATGEVARSRCERDGGTQNEGPEAPRFSLARLALADADAEPLARALLGGATDRGPSQAGDGPRRDFRGWTLQQVGSSLVWRDSDGGAHTVTLAPADLVGLRSWFQGGRK